MSVDAWGECRNLDWRGETDADGRFTWADALRSGDIFFVVWKARYPQAFQRKLSTSDPNPFITLNQPVRVRGSVVDAETGRPIDTFDVVPGETSELPCSAGFEVISALFLVCVEVDSACGTKHPSDGASLP